MSRHAVDDSPDCVGEMNEVAFRVFAALGRDMPDASWDIDLVPGHLRNFLAALTGESENFEDGAKRARYSSCSQDDRCQLPVIQSPVADTIRCAKTKPLDRRNIDHGPPYAPPKERHQDFRDVAGGPRPRWPTSLTRSIMSRRLI